MILLVTIWSLVWCLFSVLPSAFSAFWPSYFIPSPNFILFLSAVFSSPLCLSLKLLSSPLWYIILKAESEVKDCRVYWLSLVDNGKVRSKKLLLLSYTIPPSTGSSSIFPSACHWWLQQYICSSCLQNVPENYNLEGQIAYLLLGKNKQLPCIFLLPPSRLC